MDPSAEDDLFADLYGDDEQPKSTSTELQPTKISTPTVGQKPAAASIPPISRQISSQPPPKAVDPRQPLAIKPETESTSTTQQQPSQALPPAQQIQSIPTHEPQVESTYEQNKAPEYSWNASSAGHGGHEHQGYDQMSGQNTYGDHATGSPAIKEDGKMFIGGLNWETTDESLKDYFSQFGEVTECTVMRDGPTGRSRGFGFLTFKDPKTVNIVMVKEHYLDGKIIDPKRAIPRDEQEKTSKIFVGGVSQEAGESDFREYFMQFGRVLDATLMMDKDTGRPRGFGFVTFDSESAVENALNCPSLEIMGKPIEVKKAQPRGKNFDDRDDRFRDRGHHNRNDQQRDNYNNGGGHGMQQQNSAQTAAYNGFTPQMMAQYWQNMQRYMAAMQQFGRGGGGVQMPAINPAMMQQAMATMGQQGMMNPQMMQQMQMQQPMMRQQPQGQPPQQSLGSQGGSPAAAASPDASPGPAAFANPVQNPAAAAAYQQQQGQAQGGQFEQGAYNQRFTQHPSQRDYQPPNQQPSSWEGMYDDVPQQPGAQQQQQQRTGTPNAYNRFDGPPPNAPTGPKSTRPGSNYRGGGRGGGVGPIAPGGARQGAGAARGGFHPYQRTGERFS